MVERDHKLLNTLYMPNNYVFVDQILPAGFTMPSLSFLTSDVDQFKTAYYQPISDVNVTDTNVAPVLDLKNKFVDFIKVSQAASAKILCSPEYSLQISTLDHLIGTNLLPEVGSLWIFGGESILPENLVALKARHPNILWHHENVTTPGTFLNPLFYVFKIVDGAGTAKDMILIQFKSKPCSGGELGIENTKMKIGTQYYIFRNSQDSILLLTLICSDAFNESRVTEINALSNSPLLVFHIQLNENTRHHTFTSYKKILFNAGNKNRDIYCLNWADSTRLITPLATKTIKDSFSSHFTQAEKVKTDDDTVYLNHLKGLYILYWNNKKSYAYAFNPRESVFVVSNHKPSQTLSPFANRGRYGLRVEEVYEWSTDKWAVCAEVDDGFEAKALAYSIQEEVGDLQNVMALERALHIAVGQINTNSSNDSNWHKLESLFSFEIGEEEKIHRLTCLFENHNECTQKVNGIYSSVKNLKRLLKNSTDIPEGIKKSLDAGWSFNSKKESPDLNIQCQNDASFMASYLGEQENEEFLQKQIDNVKNCASSGNKSRVLIFYKKDGRETLLHTAPNIVDPERDSQQSIVGISHE